MKDLYNELIIKMKKKKTGQLVEGAYKRTEKCERCDEMVKDMYSHKTMAHDAERFFQCDCGKRFAAVEALYHDGSALKNKVIGHSKTCDRITAKKRRKS